MSSDEVRLGVGTEKLTGHDRVGRRLGRRRYESQCPCSVRVEHVDVQIVGEFERVLLQVLVEFQLGGVRSPLARLRTSCASRPETGARCNFCQIYC